MRAYVPATPAALVALARAGTLPTPGGGSEYTAFAVTPGLRAWYLEDAGPRDDPPEEEDLEFAASAEAARASLRLLGAGPPGPARRVVVAVDVADDALTVRDDLDRGVVRIGAPITASAVAAVFADDRDAEATVTRAVAVVDAADLGEPAAVDAVDDAEGFELSWYGPGELDGLVSDLGTAAGEEVPPAGHGG